MEEPSCVHEERKKRVDAEDMSDIRMRTQRDGDDAQMSSDLWRREVWGPSCGEQLEALFGEVSVGVGGRRGQVRGHDAEVRGVGLVGHALEVSPVVWQHPVVDGPQRVPHRRILSDIRGVDVYVRGSAWRRRCELAQRMSI